MPDNAKDGPPLRGFRIRSAYDVRRVIARIMKELYRGEISPDVGAKLGYLASVWLKSNEASDLESRIERLETQAKGDGDTSQRTPLRLAK